MTKTELISELVGQQRRFEWELARDEYTRAAGKLVAGRTHDLLNLVQIVKLASAELEKRCDPTGIEFVTDLTRAALDAEVSLKGLLAEARPEHVLVRGAPVGPVVTRVIETVRAAIPIDLHLAIDGETATALSEAELEHLIIGIALDAAAAPRVELFVRDRKIDDVPWVEIVRGADVADGGFDLKAVELLVVRGGGELSSCERRGGGTELVVALPAMPS